jgi:hypothetical protein
MQLVVIAKENNQSKPYSITLRQIDQLPVVSEMLPLFSPFWNKFLIDFVGGPNS